MSLTVSADSVSHLLHRSPTLVLRSRRNQVSASLRGRGKLLAHEIWLRSILVDVRDFVSCL